MHLRRRQDGFTLPAVLAMLVIALAFAVVAYSAAAGGMRATGESRNGKQAYAAAEAGLNWYLSRLVYDNAFWTKCTSVASPSAPVNDPWIPARSTDPDPRQWRAVPDSDAEYTIELLPANGATACSRSNPSGTMIDASTRAFRIRATGRFAGEKRALVATFRRARFLDFLYLTEYETTDPLNYPDSARATADACKDKLRPQRPSNCREIQFASGDVLSGPVRSNDSFLVCGGATFGRSRADAIESSSNPAYYRVCSGAPRFLGTLRSGTNAVDMPESDAELRNNVLPAYRFTGKTEIVLNGSSISVTGGGNAATRTLAWPANGLIYVEAGASCTSRAPAEMLYTGTGRESDTCATAYVSGTYAKSITVASARDVVIKDDITAAPNTDVVAGLIAGRFARVYHPVTTLDTDDNGVCQGQNAAGSKTDLTIEAAILAVSNSFTVDNYGCGDSLGTLSVTGGIAQSYRGAVATTRGSGYRKNYVYDDRFVYRNPPYFLEPSRATWRIVRSAEQLPAR